jgi:hypothetical protein
MATILVVDDELGIRDLLSEILNDEGHTVELAENAAQARAIRAQLRPDLVTVAVGANDMRRFDAARFSDSLDALLAGLPAHAIVADLPCFHFGPREGDAVVASRMIRERARSSPRWWCIGSVILRCGVMR